MRSVRTFPIRAVAAGVLGVLAAMMLASTALGRDVEDITVSEGQTVDRNYGPIAASEPPEGRVEGLGSLFGGFFRGAANCRSLAYCDTIDLTIETPATYTNEDFFRIDITLTWANTDLNNLDLYLHRGTSPFAVVFASQTDRHPEKISLQDPPDKKYAIVVSNRQGPNSGYRLSVTFVPQGRISAFDESEEFGRSGSGFFGDDSSAGVFDLPSPPQPDGVAASTGPRPIERPGPDGSPSRRTLAVLSTSSPPGPSSRLPFIASSLAAALVATGLGVFLYLRGRGDSDF